MSGRSFFSKLSLRDGMAGPVTVALIDVYLSVLPRRALITRLPLGLFTLASSPRMHAESASRRSVRVTFLSHKTFYAL